MDILYFDEAAHSYVNFKGEPYKGATTFLKQVEKPFPTDYMSSRKAIQKYYLWESGSKDLAEEWERLRSMFNAIQDDDDRRATIANNFIKNSSFRAKLKEYKQQYIDEWNHTSDLGKAHGTKEHKIKEDLDLLNLGRTVFEHRSDERGRKMSVNIGTLPHNVWIPEVIVSNDRYKLCGTVDRLMLSPNPITGRLTIHIDDWKTNKKIEVTNGYKQKYLHPVDHLDDCEWNKYRLQLSLYFYLIVKDLGAMNCEFGSIQFTWLKREGGQKVFAFTPLIKEIKDIINVYCKPTIHGKV